MMRAFALVSLAIVTAFFAGRIFAYQAAPGRPGLPPSSHEVNADSSVTFRFRDTGASKVEVHTDAALKPLSMTRDAQGLWSATTEPLKPEIYGYQFFVDGMPMLDPRNSDVRHNLAFASNEVKVVGNPPSPWDLSDIPHGVVSRHVFTTHIAKNLPQNQSAYVVYTPPGYDPKHKGGYPVLYLLHGYTDSDDGWTQVGRAQFILDSLIDGGKAVPMIVVMPLGYGNFQFLTGGFSNWNVPAAVNENTSLYGQLLLQEVMPAIDREFNVGKGRENHAIAGLSMGGLESLTIGLNHTDLFAYVGGFSSAVHNQNLDQQIPGIDAKKADLKLLWVACGTDDGLITPNRTFVAWARTKGLPITPIETPGAHTWLVWRDNLLNFAPLLFRK